MLFYWANYLQPNTQSKLQKEGAESEQFWDLLGGKSEYPSQKLTREHESDPHLFSCTLTKGMSIFVCILILQLFYFLVNSVQLVLFAFCFLIYIISATGFRRSQGDGGVQLRPG